MQSVDAWVRGYVDAWMRSCVDEWSARCIDDGLVVELVARGTRTLILQRRIARACLGISTSLVQEHVSLSSECTLGAAWFGRSCVVAKVPTIVLGTNKRSVVAPASCAVMHDDAA